MYVDVWVTGPKTVLHSGIYGGMVYEPMTALIALLNTLVGQDTKIKITDAYKDIDQPSEAEVYGRVTFVYTTTNLTSPIVRHTRTSTTLSKIFRLPLATLLCRTIKSLC